MDGILLLNKEKNISTRDYCFKASKIIGEPHFGHTGTLDPLATGLVVMLLGQATKLNQYIDSDIKGYVAKILLGTKTDTYDITGNILEEKKVHFDFDELNKALTTLKMQDKQIPPIYSAIKKNGKKLYDYARKNQMVDIDSRDVKIYRLDLVKYEQINNLHYVLVKMLVSKGFYVRSFVNDLGEMLGYGATLTELNRYQAGCYKIEDSYHISELENGYKIITIEDIFADLPAINIDDFTLKLVKNGVIFDQRQADFDTNFRVLYNDRLVAVYAPIGENQYKAIWKDGVFLASV